MARSRFVLTTGFHSGIKYMTSFKKLVPIALGAAFLASPVLLTACAGTLKSSAMPAGYKNLDGHKIVTGSQNPFNRQMNYPGIEKIGRTGPAPTPVMDDAGASDGMAAAAPANVEESTVDAAGDAPIPVLSEPKQPEPVSATTTTITPTAAGTVSTTTTTTVSDPGSAPPPLMIDPSVSVYSQQDTVAAPPVNAAQAEETTYIYDARNRSGAGTAYDERNAAGRIIPRADD